MGYLKRFLEDLCRTKIKLGTGFSDEERMDIFDAVNQMVQRILAELSKRNPKLHVSKIHPVGSFPEGTKIGDPNEFDFVAEMEWLNNFGNMVDIRYECPNPGNVHVIFKEWVNISNNDRLLSSPRKPNGSEDEWYLSSREFRQHFWLDILGSMERMKTDDIKIHKRTGMLFLDRELSKNKRMFSSLNKGPNCEISMNWKSKMQDSRLAVSVDITPSFNLDGNIPESSMIATELTDKFSDKFGHGFRVVKASSQCRMAGVDVLPDICWGLSFSHIETQLVADLPVVHKNVLRILKYIVGPDYHVPMNTLPTYMPKTAALHHSLICSHQLKTLDICLLETLDYILDCIDRNFLPSVLITNKNVWSHRLENPRYGPEILKPCLKGIKDALGMINKSSTYDFDEFYAEFMEQCKNLRVSNGPLSAIKVNEKCCSNALVS